MSILRRVRNLWAWSAVDPKPMRASTGADLTQEQARQIAGGNAVIIISQDPADELIETIREENTRQA